MWTIRPISVAFYPAYRSVRPVGTGSTSDKDTVCCISDESVGRAVEEQPFVTGKIEKIGCGELPDVVLPVIVNAKAGSVIDVEETCARLRRAFAAVDRRVACLALAPAEINTHLRSLVREGCAAVGVAGGDGTLSSAANLLADTDTLLLPLPLGTRNHFARDLGVPLNLDRAVRGLVMGRVRTIDVGDVNGRLFLNNASVGLYTRAVRWREWLMADRPYVGKRIATLYALALMARRLPRYRLFLEIDGSDLRALHVPFLFIGNNCYAERPLDLVSRQRLNAGRLHLAYPEGAGIGAVVRLVVGLLVRPLVHVPGLQTTDVRDVSLRARRKHLTVALDGELHRMAQPLQFRVREGSLRVLAPEVRVAAEALQLVPGSAESRP